MINEATKLSVEDGTQQNENPGVFIIKNLIN